MLTSIIVATIALLILSLPFYIVIGVGSLQCYAALSNASEEVIAPFLKKLKFPFTIYSRGEGIAHVVRESASIAKGRVACLSASVVPFVASLAVLLLPFTRNPNASDITWGVFGFAVLLVPIIRMWSFGHRLMTL